MSIIGTNFTEIIVKKNKHVVKGLKVSNNLGIKSIEKMDLSFGKTNKQAGLKFVFEYSTKYEPGVASINLVGDVLVLEAAEKVEKVLKDWKDKKPIDEGIMTEVMNNALNKATVKAIIFSQDMNLPAPVKLPKVVQKPKSE
ncbi:hypothetical protein KY334_05080 [Candidatus Woesearchaeota archaeon]|nr:hypothetical protein [Candidatus Woesearchaeota archaeon]